MFLQDKHFNDIFRDLPKESVTAFFVHQARLQTFLSTISYYLLFLYLRTWQPSDTCSSCSILQDWRYHLQRIAWAERTRIFTEESPGSFAGQATWQHVKHVRWDMRAASKASCGLPLPVAVMFNIDCIHVNHAQTIRVPNRRSCWCRQSIIPSVLTLPGAQLHISWHGVASQIHDGNHQTSLARETTCSLRVLYQ